MNVVRSAMPGMPARMRRIRSTMYWRRGLAPHPLQHVLVDVLQGDVHVARHLGAFGDGLNQLVRPVRRVGVEQANPELAGQGIQLAQQGANRGGLGRERLHGRAELLRRGNRAAAVRAQVQAVVGRVLRDQVQLLHAVGNQRLGFGDDVRLRPAAMRAPHAGNDAEAARMIAALGDLDVGEVARRQPEARRRVVGDVARTGLTARRGEDGNRERRLEPKASSKP